MLAIATAPLAQSFATFPYFDFLFPSCRFTVASIAVFISSRARMNPIRISITRRSVYVILKISPRMIATIPSVSITIMFCSW